jgi:transposase
MELADQQWALIEPLIPEPRMRDDGRGRPWKDARAVLNGILWILQTGARWKDMPERYPPYQTCHRRFQEGVKDGTIVKILRALANDLKERGGIDVSETFIDGTFVGAKKGGSKSGLPSVVRGRRSWRLQTALVFLSPFALRAVLPTKSPLLRMCSKVDSCELDPDE